MNPLAWLVLWLGSLIVVALAILAVLPASLWTEARFAALGWKWLLAAAAVALTALVHRMGTSTFGRAVRYTRADPDNIAARRCAPAGIVEARGDQPLHAERAHLLPSVIGSVLVLAATIPPKLRHTSRAAR